MSWLTGSSYRRSKYRRRPVNPLNVLPAPAHEFTFITQFQPGHGFNLSPGSANPSSESSDDPAFGAQSIKFVRDSTPGNTSACWKSGFALNLTDKNLAVWIRRPTNSGALNVYAGDAGLANYYYWNAGGTTPIAGIGAWEYFILPFSAASVTGSPNRANIARLHFTGNVGADLAPVYLGAVATTPIDARYPNGVVSITFDDSLDDAYAIARPLMSARGFGGTGYVLPYTQDGAGVPTMAQLHEMEDVYGWEIAGHSFSQHTDLTTLTLEQAEYELREMRKWLTQNGFRGEQHFAYPYGARNEAVKAIARKYFQTARVVTNSERNALLPESARLHELNCYTWGNPSSVAQFKGYLDKTKSAKSWAVMLFHTLGSGTDDITEAEFTELLDYMTTIGIAVEPVGKVMGNWG